MNFKSLCLLCLLSITSIYGLMSQDIDTLVDVGGFKMHFNIWEGGGMPILFEAGGGNDGTIWHDLIKDIYEITNAKIITYDRSGYGQSEYNPRLADDKKSLITHGIDNLTKGLKALDVFDELVIVAHSYGGLYASLLSSKYPYKVKGIVLIDASLNSFYTDEYIEEVKAERTDVWLADIKSKSEPLYYECLANMESIEIMKKVETPLSIPVYDLVAEFPPFSEENNIRWKECHKVFDEKSPNRERIVASNCNHYLHYDYSILAVNAIVKMYAKTVERSDFGTILEKTIEYNINEANEYRAGEFDYWHSERDLNNWGYELLSQEEWANAEKILELNTILFPESPNVWDSYGEILLARGAKNKSIEMYLKSLELDPDNQGLKDILKELGQQR